MGHTSPVAESDPELARRLADRDPSAFEALYRRYGPAAYGLALRIVRQPAFAQEVVAEAFTALWAAPEAYDPVRGTFRTFLLSLVHHRAVDLVRREERLRDRERRVNPEPQQDEDIADAITEEAELADRRREVREAISTLPVDQRTALELMYFKGWTQSRIARELDIPLGTVKTRVLAAMRKLRTRMT